MRLRFRIELNNEAASQPEAAFLFHDKKPLLKAVVLSFRTVEQRDQYESAYPIVRVRRVLPLLVELREYPETLTLAQRNRWMKRLAAWYFYTVLNPDEEMIRRMEQDD
ncbi:hypothetical protein [Arsenicibacter rosenii]|uniref:Uncharacterized protein n=1 Tax=Arsenicibacter rosenii TaxID=1750698 RepID=A0A1S2V9L6_9BACT|nr:hypothetical protein [Arsenicibacter rosenii]OIN55434.1 hypothetical protein BLX24_30805 [Arsenicibacter rosenii]